MLSAISVNKVCCGQPPLVVHPEGTQDGKEQDTGSSILFIFDMLRCLSKERCQRAQILPSSHTQKSAKFINLRCLVFFN